jgi:hypothetical protein
MKKLLFLTLILLVSVGWAVAQSTASPSATPDQSQQPGAAQSPSAQPGAPAQQPGMSGQQPGMPSPADQASQAGQDASATAGGNSIEGCLGGSAGSFTIIDKAGTTYQLQLPAGADSAKLTSHVGEEVRVTGSMSNEKGGASAASATSASGASGAAGNQPTIAVTKIDKIADKCTTNTQNAPSK